MGDPRDVSWNTAATDTQAIVGAVEDGVGRRAVAISPKHFFAGLGIDPKTRGVRPRSARSNATPTSRPEAVGAFPAASTRRSR